MTKKRKKWESRKKDKGKNGTKRRQKFNASVATQVNNMQHA